MTARYRPLSDVRKRGAIWGRRRPQARSAEDGGWGQLVAFCGLVSRLSAIRLLSRLKAVFMAGVAAIAAGGGHLTLALQ